LNGGGYVCPVCSAAHEDIGNQALVRLIKKDKVKFMAEVRKRWKPPAKRNCPFKLTTVYNVRLR